MKTPNVALLINLYKAGQNQPSATQHINPSNKILAFTFGSAHDSSPNMTVLRRKIEDNLINLKLNSQRYRSSSSIKQIRTYFKVPSKHPIYAPFSVTNKTYFEQHHGDEVSRQSLENDIKHKLWIEQPENIPTCLAIKPYVKEHDKINK
uniref:Uncharacterized protein n=1 Tax=Glossina brevipalpis TaxID=37001 RepID=A0A1A9W469_9MUSC